MNNKYATPKKIIDMDMEEIEALVREYFKEFFEEEDD